MKETGVSSVLIEIRRSPPQLSAGQEISEYTVYCLHDDGAD